MIFIVTESGDGSLDQMPVKKHYRKGTKLRISFKKNKLVHVKPYSGIKVESA